MWVRPDTVVTIPCTVNQPLGTVVSVFIMHDMHFAFESFDFPRIEPPD